MESIHEKDDTRSCSDPVPAPKPLWSVYRPVFRLHYDSWLVVEGSGEQRKRIADVYGEANACLTAAAPDLLAVAHWALARLVSGPLGDKNSEAMQLQRALRAAIEKAKGEVMNATATMTKPAEESADQRYARRRADPISHAVAVEQAAQAYATAQGWDWPSLTGYGVPEGRNAELVRLEARQKIRFFARVMVDEYDRHLQQGGRDREAEQRIAAAIRSQHYLDAAKRKILRPKPMLSFLTPLTGD